MYSMSDLTLVAWALYYVKWVEISSVARCKSALIKGIGDPLAIVCDYTWSLKMNYKDCEHFCFSSAFSIEFLTMALL